jgi:VWFA-related protein
MPKALSILVLLALTLPLGAQQETADAPEQEEEYRVRVQVELVTAPVVVQNRRGEFVYDLRREEVTVFDNGVPQQITTFELASQPISLVILADTSQRIAPLLERVQKSGILFTSYILGQFGEAAVITFDDDVTLRHEFTSDHDEVIEAMANIKAGGADARLADALTEAVNLLLRRPEGRRRVIIAVTEPNDRGSHAPIGIPLRNAQLAEISVYTLALSPTHADLRRRPEDSPTRSTSVPPGVFGTPPLPGQVQTPTTEVNREVARVDLLNAIRVLVSTLQHARTDSALEIYAQGTGGLHYSSSWSRSGFEESLNLIGQDLHNQYMVSYRPSNRTQSGFHQIEVSVSRPGVTVRTRPGYFVGPPPAETP